jgi:hypothetical protein
MPSFESDVSHAILVSAPDTFLRKSGHCHFWIRPLLPGRCCTAGTRGPMRIVAIDADEARSRGAA